MRRIVAAAVMISLAALACGGDTTPTIAPQVEAILAASAAEMGDVDTVRFTLERGGAPVFIDDLETIAFESAEGRYAAPGRADAVVQVTVVGLSMQIGAVAVDGETWITNPITGRYEPAPGGYAFDPATLFDPTVGLPVLLSGELADPELVGLEERDDGERYHVTGNAPAERVEVITASMVRDQDVTLELWVDPVTGDLTEAAFATVHGGEESTWRLTFFEYGAEVVIDPPELDG
jgi:lipoprotein LprG